MKQMALRHAGTCRVCAVPLPAKSTAVYDFTAKNVLCLACAGAESEERDELSPRPAENAGDSRRTRDRRIGERRRSASTS